MGADDKARDGDRACPYQGKRHRQIAVSRPDSRQTQCRGGRKGGGTERVPTWKAGSPVPLRFPQGGAGAVDDHFQRVDDQRCGDHGDSHEPCFDATPGYE